MELFVPSQSASVDLAEALLRAWIRGDRLEVENEIYRSSAARQPTSGGDDEKLDLLKAVAERMSLLPDLFAPCDADPQLDLCLNLLLHLAAGPSLDKKPLSTWPAPARCARQLGTPAARLH